RMLEGLARAGAFSRGGALARMLERMSSAGADTRSVPEPYWTALPGPPGDDGEEQIWLRGGVVVRVVGRTVAAGRMNGAQPAKALPPELVAALREPTPWPWREVVNALRDTGLLDPVLVGGAAILAAIGVLAEALLFRALLDLGYALG